MRSLLPILVVVFVLVATAFAVALWVVLLSSGSCSSSTGPVGVVLVYEIDPESGHDLTSAEMERLIAAINRRVNPGWSRSAQVQQREDGRIEVAILGDDPEAVRRIEFLLANAGTLEFRILANNLDHKELIDQAGREDGDVLRNEAGDLVAWWVPVEQGAESALQGCPEIATRTKTRAGRQTLEVLVVKDQFNVTGGYLERADSSVDPGTGNPCIAFQLNPAGAKLFGGLTGKNLPDPVRGFTRKLGIILNGRLRSAPAIQSTIFQRGQITGNFTQQEVENLVTLLNSGTMPVQIRQIERKAVGKPQ